MDRQKFESIINWLADEGLLGPGWAEAFEFKARERGFSVEKIALAIETWG